MDKKIKENYKYIYYWLISFLIISIFSFVRDPFLDEIVSIVCSFNFSECIIWDTQTPIFYFFIRPLTYLKLRIEIIRIILSILISFSVILMLRIINMFKKLSLLEEILFIISISFIPLIYSSTIVRPYSISAFLSVISLYYFLSFLKKSDFKSFKKSLLIDSTGFLIFYFNIIFLLSKILFIFLFRRNFTYGTFKESIKIFLPSILALFSYISFIFINFKTFESWDIVTKHYKEYKEYYSNFLINYPIEFYKEQTVIIPTFPFFQFYPIKLIAQAIFYYPFFIIFFKKEKSDLLFFYSILFIILLITNIILSIITLRFLILSRQFTYFSFPLINLLIIILAKNNRILLNLLLLTLPLTFIDYTIFRFNAIINNDFVYFPIFEIMKHIPRNETLIITPYYYSLYFWYSEVFIEKRNITIFDIIEPLDWYKKENDFYLSLRFWNTDIYKKENFIIDNYIVFKKEEIRNITKVFFNIFDSKTYCNDIVKELKRTNSYILICK